MNQYNVLIVDDNDFDQYAIKRQLRNQPFATNLQFVRTVSETKLALMESTFDIILLDFRLIDGTAFDVLDLVSSTPVILISGMGDEKIIIEAMKKGVTDYLMKDCLNNYLNLLPEVMVRAIKRKSLEKDFLDSQEELRYRNQRNDKELFVARTVQNAIIADDIPENPNLEISVLYKPCEKVGGDYFSLIPLEGDKLGVFIADIAGRGTVAALFLSLVQFVSKSVGHDYCQFPALFMQQLNSELIHEMPDSFLTASYGIFKKEQDSDLIRFTYSNAAHPFPLWYQKQNDRIDFLKTKGTFLGMFDKIETEEKSILLDKGDQLIYYTDSILECVEQRGNTFTTFDFLSFIQHSIKSTIQETLFSLDDSISHSKDSETLNDDLIVLGFQIK